MTWYVAGNLVEALLWLGCGAFYGYKAVRLQPYRWFRPALAITFVIFGSSDLVESLTIGRLPWWLWAWKFVGGLALFGLLIVEDYDKRGKPALAPYRFVAAGLILVMALWCIAHQAGS